mmetsp:Transcript_16813/g.25903  ORF Transcript_16813/g.25903 Transcript_16813/m.25903 type:complete len:352 (+) Transcript_16813:62-1117(+)
MASVGMTQSMQPMSLVDLQARFIRSMPSNKIVKPAKKNPSHKSKLKFHGSSQRVHIPDGVGGRDSLMNGPQPVNIRSTKTRLYSLRYQPTPINDYLNFKKMSSNEILLNMENSDNFQTSEMIGALMELARRDPEGQFNWNEHPFVWPCLERLKILQPQLTPKHLLQTQLILERLRVTDSSFWKFNSLQVIRLLHTFKARDFAQFLDLFDRDVMEIEGEPVGVVKAEDIFFERIVGLLPMFVKEMTHQQVIRSLEVCVRRNIGSQRLFDHYFLFMIERHLLKYDTALYSRMVRAMADKGFEEDFVFWDKFAFKFVYTDLRELDGVRRFSQNDAKQLWDTFVYLKLKCPSIDI